MKKATALLVLMALIIGCEESSVSITQLTCEYLIDPIGIDVTEPRLSWQLEYYSRINKKNQCLSVILH